MSTLFGYRSSARDQDILKEKKKEDRQNVTQGVKQETDSKCRACGIAECFVRH